VDVPSEDVMYHQYLRVPFDGMVTVWPMASVPLL
jgi:hypothetical protein